MAPQPQRVDLRSLAAFRILLSLFILHDIYRRLEHGRLSLAWYYASDNDAFESPPSSYFLPSILDEQDTPHGSPVHKFWFYRGSPQLQIIIFITTILLAITFGIGYKTQPTSLLIWLFMNGIQNRSPHLADGSDLFLRNMLLWCTVCPVGQMWSVDAANERRRSLLMKSNASKKKDDTYIDDDDDGGIDNATKTENGTEVITKSGTTLRHRSSQKKVTSHTETIESPSSSSTSKPNGNNIHHGSQTTVVQSVATLGITLQIVLMYYGASIRRFDGYMWVYPNFNAVHYVLNSAFASRQWAADFIRVRPTIARLMTVGGMIVETICPLACLLMSCDDEYRTTIITKKKKKKSWRHIPAAILAFFHLTLYACMILFNWQFISIISCVIWIPSHVWDSFERATGLRKETPITEMKGKVANHKSFGSDGSQRRMIGEYVRKCCSSFFLFYMVYNWFGQNEYIPQHDGGDVGEFLRFNQNWLMYGPDAPRDSMIALITGKIEPGGDDSNDHDTTKEHYLDILKAIRTKDWSASSEIDRATYLAMKKELPGDMAARFPSFRWELALNDWVHVRVKPHNMTPERRLTRLGRVLCVAANDELTKQERSDKKISSVELAFWTVRTVDFGIATKEHRFDRADSDFDTVFEVRCD